MRRAWVLLAVLAMVAAASLVWWAARPTLASVECRVASAPYTREHLSPGAVADIEDTWRIDPGSLREPSIAEARAGDAFDSRPDTWVCGYGPHEVMVIGRDYTPLEHCFGGPGCGPEPMGWVTCFDTLDLATRARTHPRGCLGFPD